MSKAINLTLGEEQVYPVPYMPIGTIYMNRHNVDPSKLFGGEWERLEDMFLIGASELYPAGTTGGEAEHILKEEEMPKHTHTTSTTGEHNHNVGFKEHRIPTANYSGSSDYARKRDAAADTRGLITYDDGTHVHILSETGGNVAHNNIPPYKAVYMWERVA